MAYRLFKTRVAQTRSLFTSCTNGRFGEHTLPQANEAERRIWADYVEALQTIPAESSQLQF